MSLVGGLRSGTGGTKTTGGPDESDNPKGTVESVTSPLGTITIISPNGPNVHEDVTFGGAPPNVDSASRAGVANSSSRSDHTHKLAHDATLTGAGTDASPLGVVATPNTSTQFDLFLSYGHGMAVDANLPALGSFWFSPTTIADLATAAQVREWVTEEALAFLELVVRVDAAHLVTGGGSFIVTMNGLDTAIAVAVATGDTANTTLTTSALFTVPVGSKIGVRWDGSAAADGSTLRAEIRLRGALSGTPVIPDTLPINPLALFRPEDLAADGSSWVDSVPGNVYTLTVPIPGFPPPAGLDPISGPAKTTDGSFNGHPYGYYRHYAGGDFGHPTYTPCMLSTDTPMFANSAVPIAPRTIAIVCKADSVIGGVLASCQFSTPCFQAALDLPPGDLLQAAYFNTSKDAAVTDHLVTNVNLAGQEIVLIWRTDGTTVDFFINGVKQPLDSNLVGTDAAAFQGFCLGNLASPYYSSKRGWQGGLCFGGVWARNFTDAEVISATGNLAAEYVTP